MERQRDMSVADAVRACSGAEPSPFAPAGENKPAKEQLPIFPWRGTLAVGDRDTPWMQPVNGVLHKYG